jgi:hypothetical protein
VEKVQSTPGLTTIKSDSRKTPPDGLRPITIPVLAKIEFQRSTIAGSDIGDFDNCPFS